MKTFIYYKQYNIIYKKQKVIVMKDSISIVKIGKIVGKCCDEFKDVWTGYDVEQDKIDIICAVHKLNPEQQLFHNLESKISVNIAREYGTQFVEKFCNIKIINYL